MALVTVKYAQGREFSVVNQQNTHAEHKQEKGKCRQQALLQPRYSGGIETAEYDSRGLVSRFVYRGLHHQFHGSVDLFDIVADDQQGPGL